MGSSTQSSLLLTVEESSSDDQPDERTASGDAEPEEEQQDTHKTLFHATMSTMTIEELTVFLVESEERCEDTKRKEAWVLTLYGSWCRTLKVIMFPLEQKYVCPFIRFLALKCGYALSGIKLIVVPCLRHLNYAYTKSEDPGIVDALKHVIKTLERNPHVKKAGPGKPPLLSFDVAELIKRIPDTLSFKAMEASLFLFALHTGSRAITCENIHYGDIVGITDDPRGAIRVTIMENVTKGDYSWNHLVTIEGFTDISHPLDAVYWLNKHTVSSIGMTLRQIADRSYGPHTFDNQTVWPLARDAMRERIKTRLVQAGFPKGRWSFHSLRSGHICTCLVAAGADPEKRTAVLEVTAIVAGWQVYGRAQRGYIKHVAERTIVSSRLIGAGVNLHPELAKATPSPAPQAPLSHRDPSPSPSPTSSTSTLNIKTGDYHAPAQHHTPAPAFPPGMSAVTTPGKDRKGLLQSVEAAMDLTFETAPTLDHVTIEKSIERPAGSTQPYYPGQVVETSSGFPVIYAPPGEVIGQPPKEQKESQGSGESSSSSLATPATPTTTPPNIQSCGFIEAPGNTEEFHMVKLKPPCFPEKLFFDDLRRYWNAAFVNPAAEPKRVQAHTTNCFNCVLVSIGKPSTPTEAKPWYHWRAVGHCIVRDWLMKDHSHPKEVAEWMLSRLQTLGKSPTVIPIPLAAHPKATPISPRTPRQQVLGRTHKLSRKRIPWEPDEDIVLLKARKDNIPFRQIMNQLPRRELVDCYDRWKIFVRNKITLESVEQILRKKEASRHEKTATTQPLQNPTAFPNEQQTDPTPFEEHEEELVMQHRTTTEDTGPDTPTQT